MDMSRMNIRIESAETGEVFVLRREASIDQLKMELGLLQPIASADQILLMGPPFKSFDNQYRPDISLENKRIFLFSRRIIADESLKPCIRPRGSSYDIPQPEPISGAVDASHILDIIKDEALVNKLVEYIQFFRSELHKNRFYESYVQQATSACKLTVTRLDIQLDAIAAVTSNLQDIFANVAKNHSNLQATFTQQQETHRHLLETFENNLETLKSIPLHPAFLQSYERWKQHQLALFHQQQHNSNNNSSNNMLSASWSTHISGNNNPMNVNANTAVSEPQFPSLQSLYDCIPVDKERRFHQQSLDNHRHLSTHFTLVQANFQAVKYSVENVSKTPVEKQAILEWSQLLENEESNYARGLEQLRSTYQMVYDALTTNIPQDVSALQRLLTKCAERRLEYETGGNTHPIISLDNNASNNANGNVSYLEQGMKSLVHRLQQWQMKLETIQEQTTKTMYTMVRQINAIHNDIQFKLKNDIEWMKKLTLGTNEYIVHLKSLSLLPSTYQSLLKELQRRKHSLHVLQHRLKPAKQTVQDFRVMEIMLREQFMKEYGLNLPPIFLKMIPSLKEKPPLVDWEVLQEDTLLSMLEEIEEQDVVSVVHDEEASKKDSATTDTNHDHNTHQEAMETLKNQYAKLDKEKQEETHAKVLLLQQKEEEIMTLATRVTRLTEETSHYQKIWKEENTKRLQEESHWEREKQEMMQQIAALQAKVTQLESTVNASNANNTTNNTDNETNTGTDNAPDNSTPEDISTNNNIDNNTIAKQNSPKEQQLLQFMGDVHRTYQGLFTYLEECMVVERPLQTLLKEDTDVALLLSTYRSDITYLSSDKATSKSQTSKSNNNKSDVNNTNVGLTNVEAMFEKLMDLQLRCHDTFQDVIITNTATTNNSDNDSTNSRDTTNEVLVSVGDIERVRDIFRTVHHLFSAVCYRRRLPTLSFMDFKIGDYAVFMPGKIVNEKVAHWLAFQAGDLCRHFLAEESWTELTKQGRNHKSLICRLILIEYFVVPDGTDASEHVYNLPAGTKYAVCQATPLYKSSSKNKGSSALSSMAATSGKTST